MIWSHYCTMPSKIRTLIIETQLDNDQGDLEEIVHDLKEDVWEDEIVADQATTLGCLFGMHPFSIDDVDGITRQLGVV